MREPDVSLCVPENQGPEVPNMEAHQQLHLFWLAELVPWWWSFLDGVLSITQTGKLQSREERGSLKGPQEREAEQGVLIPDLWSQLLLFISPHYSLGEQAWSWNFTWEKDVSGSDGEESACSAGDLRLIPGLGRCPGEGHVNLLQYSWYCPFPRTEELGGLQYVRLQRVGMTEVN